MVSERHAKIAARHLTRNAYLYVRQSSMRQVFENTESTERQYALQQRALELGWPLEQIVVIDSDLGRSGAERDRAGFQQMVAEVSLGKAGIVMGLEVSRLARNSTDWHRLLEICALSDTLILDEDGVYDPSHFNDRLLLGLKGTMSEAELHILRARLQGGALNKARRGELRLALPVGLVYDRDDSPVLDPDQQVQQALRLLFNTFVRTGSACATVKTFHQQGVQFPRRPRHGSHKGELLWGELEHSRVLQVLHNPRYAGAFVFGRTQTRPTLDGRTTIRCLPQDQWQVVLPDCHAGYISWERFDANRRQLAENAKACGGERKSPAREGPALLQGLVMCGRCGERMTVRYTTVAGQSVPHYLCQRRGIEQSEPICQHIPGTGIDSAVGQLLMATVTPLNLDVALAVEQEVQSRVEEADALRYQQVERARYEAELARRRYFRVDPDNRLVAGSLEADWNAKLRTLKNVQSEYERQCQTDRRLLDDQQKAAIQALATDFPRVWQNPQLPHRERKRLVRLLIEDVTLIKGTTITVHVRFKGGTTQTMALSRSKNAWQLRQTDPQVIAVIDQLLNDYTDSQVAEHLNAQGLRSGTGKSFHSTVVAKLRRAYGLRSRYERLRDAGMLTAEEIAQQLDISVASVKEWRRAGRLKAHTTTGKGDYLYEPLGEHPPVKYAWQNTQKQAHSTAT